MQLLIFNLQRFISWWGTAQAAKTFFWNVTAAAATKLVQFFFAINGENVEVEPHAILLIVENVKK